MTLTTLDTLTDAELGSHIGAAVLDNDRSTLERLEAESSRRARATEHAVLAQQERDRRAAASDKADYETMLAQLAALGEDLRTRYLAKLDELDLTPPAQASPLISEAYDLGRQSYALSHDLAGITGDRRRFALRYTVPSDLVVRGGRIAETFLASRGHGRTPPVPTPWRDDLTRLRTLAGPRVELIGNGG